MEPRRVVGGLFGLADPAPGEGGGALVPDGPTVSFLACARSAMRLFALEVAPATIWLPSYLCPAVLDAFRGLAAATRFYPLQDTLEPEASGAFWGEVGSGDLVCVVDFFGRLAPRAFLHDLQARGALVLEDASQALLTDRIGDGADAWVVSPRKFVGVPEGGVLARAGPPRRAVPMERAPDQWRRAQLAAAVSRRDFDRRGGADDDRSWYAHFQRAEDAPVGVFPMAEATRAMLLGAFDPAGLAARRRANWRALAARLGPLSLLGPDLRRGEVPVGFVARFAGRAERDRVRAALVAESVYPPVHWDLGGAVPAEFEASHDLSSRVLTLPCDQRYGPAEMARIVGVVEDALGPADPRILRP